LLVVLLSVSQAAAQPVSTEPSEAQKNAAQSLFDEAKRLMQDGRVAESCAKLEESLRLYPASGTLLNLALCHERSGKTGSAYTEFNESLARATRDRRPEREQTARAHLAALAPRLARLTVTVAASADVDGLEVTLDGVPWRKPSWGVATIVDPGEHVVVATAPGRASWTGRVTVHPPDASGHGEHPAIEVPPLAPEHAAPPPVAAPPAPTGAPVAPSPAQAAPSPSDVGAHAGSGQRTLGAGLAIAGLAGVATGVVLGLLAQGKWSAAKTDCPNALCPDASTQARDSGAGGLADAATVGLVAGGVAFAAGAVLFLTAPSAPARVGLSLGPGGASAAVGGAW
jgi:hypothetical protein